MLKFGRDFDECSDFYSIFFFQDGHRKLKSDMRYVGSTRDSNMAGLKVHFWKPGWKWFVYTLFKIVQTGLL